MRQAARTDANQREIVVAMRTMGATVCDLSSVGRGCPDLLVGYRGKNFAIEIKGAKGSLTPAQIEWHDGWKGQVQVVRSIEEVVDLLGSVSWKDTVDLVARRCRGVVS